MRHTTAGGAYWSKNMGIIYRPSGRAAEYAHLAINHYVGCRHGCMYCYVPATTRNNDFHTKQAPKKDVLYKLTRAAPNFAGTDERVLLCFACDPYQPLNDELNLTREVIKILKDNDIPFQVLTKGGMRAVSDFDLYGPNDAFAATLTFLDEAKSKRAEPNAALPESRIRSLSVAKQKGIRTWVSLEPVIDTKASLELIRITHSFVDHYKIGKLNHASGDLTFQALRRFGIKAIELCREFGVDYWIKADLAKYLDGIHFTNTDTRKVKR